MKKNPRGTEFSTWDQIKTRKDFNYVVIGTGPCALAFVSRTLKNQPSANILMVERGDFHSEEISSHNDRYVSREQFPWQLSESTKHSPHVNFHHGIIPGFGGSSTLWTGWCPRPSREELPGWPEKVK